MHDISLHHIIVPDVPVAELVRLAHKLACRHVCLFVQPPAQGWRFPTVQNADLAALRPLMADHGITAYGVTSFPIFPGVDTNTYKAGLERGAALGAKYANVRIEDPDDKRATEAFGRLAELAQYCGLTASIEFTGLKKPDQLRRTLRIIKDAGLGALSIDPLQIVRTGTPLAELRSVDPAVIGYVQLCDGPLHASEAQYQHESAADRLPPGEGEFPLDEIVAVVPAGRAVSLEVPCEPLRARGVSAEDRLRRAVDATRRLLNSLGDK